MTQEEFKETASREGFDTPKAVSFEPSARSDMHTHDKVSFVYVVSGEFILNTVDGAKVYGPGETLVLDKDIEHAEEAGTMGATVLAARK